MARSLRIELPGAVYFIITKGNALQNVFLKPEDAEAWLEIFENVCGRFGWVCYSYCLMGNYYMIVVETPNPNLSRGMRQLNGIYTQKFNREHNRVGHIFQGRYKAVLVQKNKYLTDLIKYILFRPVKSGFVSSPYQFKWSSCKYLFDREECPYWFSKDYVESLFDDFKSEFSAITDSEENVLEQVRKQIFLGDEDFITEMLNHIDNKKDMREIPKIQRSVPIQQYVDSSNSREAAISKAYLSGDYTLKQLADYFSLHYSTLSRIVKEYERINKNRKFI